MYNVTEYKQKIEPTIVSLPSNILCSASICQYVIPEVEGDNDLGLCWSMTRIRK